MAAPEGFPNLSNAGKGRPKGAKNKYTIYQEDAIQKFITEENLLIRWIKKLDEKVMNDKIRPEAIASSYEKVAKHIIRTAADQEILDNVFVDTENDIEQDGNEILENLDLIDSLRKK
ncbi:hypothetical protein EWD52_23510 [Salmonella enterica subsp. enterica serovar Braenderup]|nr:hypothetical protein [Salmonella enterica subsp. enterica serovar Braenderup]ECD1500267.1 hypothetical protein [Salmonella enterica subsp. enterica serovar Braenderup]